MFIKIRDVLLPDSAILLDVDGVLLNWTAAAAKLWGTTEQELYKNWTRGDFGIDKALGISEDEMWKEIDAAGDKFWSGLEEYPWARDLFSHCNEIAPTYFVTSPSKHWSSFKGKLDWMYAFTGDPKFRNYVMGPAKHLCATPKHVLVDDYDRNIQNFRASGGHTVLFPQYWNELHEFQGDKLEHVKGKLEEWVQGQFASAALAA